MTDNKGESTEEPNEEELDKEKKPFGTLKPLTAIQIISLIVPSSPAGAGACY